jgi:excisionase family DNA binding protein
MTQTTETMERLMTIDEVADHLRVGVQTVRWLRQEGRFAPAVKVGRRLAWQESAVREWVAANRESAELL